MYYTPTANLHFKSQRSSGPKCIVMRWCEHRTLTPQSCYWNIGIHRNRNIRDVRLKLTGYKRQGKMQWDINNSKNNYYFKRSYYKGFKRKNDNNNYNTINKIIINKLRWCSFLSTKRISGLALAPSSRICF